MTWDQIYVKNFLDLIDEITIVLDKENYAISIFLDLKHSTQSIILSCYQNLTYMLYETLKISGLGVT